MHNPAPVLEKVKNGQNSEKSPGDLRRLAVTQSPVKYHQLTVMRKTLMSK